MAPVQILSLDHAPANAAAVSGDDVGIASVNGGADDFVIIAGEKTATATLAADDGKGMTYSHMGVAGGKASFAVVWSDFGGFIGYRAVDPTSKPLGPVAQLTMTSWDDNPVTITGVSDGFLLATAAGTALDDMIVSHLGCP